MSSRKPIRPRDILNPHRILSNLLDDYSSGRLADYAVLFRAVVAKVDNVGGAFEKDPPNPKGSIRARITSNARDQETATDDLPVFWPIFSHDLMPIKENEQVYVLFEDNNRRAHGLWLTRIPEPNSVDNRNFVAGSKKYKENPDNKIDSDVGAEKVASNLTEKPEPIETSPEFIVEEVKPFIARVGDRVIEGSNNTLIVLGRDRPSNRDSGQTDLAGTIDIVTGRAVADDASFADDMSRIYVSMKTDIDTNLATKNDPGPAVNGVAAIGVKSDEIRIVARKGTKVVVEGGDLYLEGKNIYVGKEAKESAMLGDTWKKYFEKVLLHIDTHFHSTSTGPSGPPTKPAPTFDINSLSKTIKLKK